MLDSQLEASVSSPICPTEEPATANRQPATSDPGKSKTKTQKRATRNGNVARLPKAIRDQLNQMLLDGVPYPQIIQRLGEPAHSLSTKNISTWKTKGGFAEFLIEQQRRDQCRLRNELLQNLATEQPGTEAYQAAPKIAVALACEALIDFGRDTLQRALKENPLNAFRLLNAMARMLSGGIKCERLLAEEADRKARLPQPDQPGDKKGLSDETFNKMNDKLHFM